MSIAVQREESVAWVTLDQPERRNPLTVEMLSRFPAILDELESDPSVRVVVLTGRGKVFCAGADLDEVLQPDGVDADLQYRMVRGFNRLVQRIRSSDLPVVAAVNGPAVGGGAALVLACDMALAAEEAQLHFAFGRVGASSADMGCTWLLPRAVGPARARHLMLTGARVDAALGEKLGLFLEVVPQDTLHSAAQALGEAICKGTPRRAAAATKMAVDLGAGIDLGTALEYDAWVQSWMFQSEEHRTRLADFMARWR